MITQGSPGGLWTRAASEIDLSITLHTFPARLSATRATRWRVLTGTKHDCNNKWKTWEIDEMTNTKYRIRSKYRDLCFFTHIHPHNIRLEIQSDRHTCCSTSDSRNHRCTFRRFCIQYDRRHARLQHYRVIRLSKNRVFNLTVKSVAWASTESAWAMAKLHCWIVHAIIYTEMSDTRLLCACRCCWSRGGNCSSTS